MTIAELITISSGAEFNVLNEPFSFAGRADITLEGGDTRHWLYNADGGMLAISPNDDEILSFDLVEEEIEPQGDTILFGGKEYEYSYEDSGVVSCVEGRCEAEDDDRLTFSDYEAEDGEVIRVVASENTGETAVYFGNTVVEEDILPLD